MLKGANKWVHFLFCFGKVALFDDDTGLAEAKVVYVSFKHCICEFNDVIMGKID